MGVGCASVSATDYLVCKTECPAVPSVGGDLSIQAVVVCSRAVSSDIHTTVASVDYRSSTKDYVQVPMLAQGTVVGDCEAAESEAGRGWRGESAQGKESGRGGGRL